MSIEICKHCEIQYDQDYDVEHEDECPENPENKVCEKCGGDGYIEIMGDGDNFECDVIGHKPCSECNDNDRAKKRLCTKCEERIEHEKTLPNLFS